LAAPCNSWPAEATAEQLYQLTLLLYLLFSWHSVGRAATSWTHPNTLNDDVFLLWHRMALSSCYPTTSSTPSTDIIFHDVLALGFWNGNRSHLEAAQSGHDGNQLEELYKPSDLDMKLSIWKLIVFATQTM